MHHRRPHTLVSLLTLVAAHALPAQQQNVFPRGMDYVEGPTLMTYPFGRTDAGVQMLIDADQISAVPVVLFGLRFRPNQVPVNATHAGYVKNYMVNAYTVSTTAASMTTNPVTNQNGAIATQVFSGPVTLPPITVDPTAPSPFSIHIPFTVPYVFDPNAGNLLLILETADVTVPPSSYRIDGVTFSATAITGIVSNLDTLGCVVNNSSLSISGVAAQAIVGGGLVHNITSTTPGAFPVVFDAVSLTVQPISLLPIGMPCTLWLSGDILTQVAIESGGYPQITWPLPVNPSLEGIPVAAQAIGLAPSLLLTESVLSNGIAARLGSSAAPVTRYGWAFRGIGSWSMAGSGSSVAVIALDY
ncbi:MAG: hypothetical protein ABIP94_17435 [Planctomycetota bacterium]